MWNKKKTWYILTFTVGTVWIQAFVGILAPAMFQTLPHELEHQMHQDPSHYTTQQQEESFSACLLTMDDYPILSEWLAYHYHALPLRHVIVAIDPRSMVSPTPIFDNWRKFGMTIVEWSDEDFFQEAIDHPLAQNATNEEMTTRHRARQKMFYQMCLQELRQENKTWTALFDTDEFLRFNLKHMHDIGLNKVPSVETPGVMLQFIRQSIQHNSTYLPGTTSCFVVPRVSVSPSESTQEQRQHLVPLAFYNQTNQLETIRFQKHAGLHGRDGAAKSILDVSQLPSVFDVIGTHRVVHTHCPHPFVRLETSVFAINHYTGSYERYFYRKDARNVETKGLVKQQTYKNLAYFQHRAKLDAHVDHDIRPWLNGFVQTQGLEAARYLLQEAGNFPPRIKNATT